MVFKKSLSKVVLVAVSVTALLVSSVGASGHNGSKKFQNGIDFKNYKNVIVLIPDGCDETIQTVARWYKGEDLQVDKMVGGGVKIHMANSVITGSAAAATAFATGHKTTVRFLGVGPRTEDLLTGFEPTAEPYAPVASILEAAKLAGKSTGLVATSRITHATPAAYASHIQDRGWDNDIMEHLVYNNLDVVFGGGARHLLPKYNADGSLFEYQTSFGDIWGGKRTDGVNLMDVLLDRGYTFVDSQDGLQALSEGPAWGLFDDSHMDPDINRAYFHPTQPSIAEMTAKAIELLSQDRDGFFLMVEGSQVDWAGHNNDPIYMTTDFLAFDEAVKVACAFADESGKTLVMAFPDHNTGGMKIGNYDTYYTALTIEGLVDPLKKMKITSGGLLGMMNDTGDDAEMVAVVKEYWGLDITDEDVAEIRSLEPAVGTAYALARVLSNTYTEIGWTTHGHNGETVPFWIHGAKNVKVGIVDNTDLAKMAADAMGVNLDRVTSKLYVELGAVTEDFEILDDGMGNLTVLVAGAELPVSKDYMVVEKKNGRQKTVRLPGITVYAPETGKVYVSKKALRVIGL